MITAAMNRMPVRPTAHKPLRTMFIMGTRPEAIKLAPVILAARTEPERFDVKLVSTGQHKQMLEQALGTFGLMPDHALIGFRNGNDLCEVTSRIVRGIGTVLSSQPADVIVVQGDTPSALAASLAASFHRIPVAHVEAGLRTYGDLSSFPEEQNRRLISRVAAVHYAPTTAAVQNLLREDIPISNIICTGNTVIDSLAIASERTDVPEIVSQIPNDKKVIVVTSHRIENIGAPLKRICAAVKKIARDHDDVEIIWPVHKNPLIRDIIFQELKGEANISLIEPLDYMSFVHLMKRSHFIMTDSGGIQEEAPAIGRPVLVMRETTERPEAVECKNAKIVGTSAKTLVEEAELLLSDPKTYKRMSGINTPFGDGKAAGRILDDLSIRFSGARSSSVRTASDNPESRAAAVSKLRKKPMEFPEASVGEGFSAVKDWLLRSGIQSERTGAIFSWYDPENHKYSYIYPEIMGYWMTAMSYLAGSEPLNTRTDVFVASAMQTGDWIIKKGFQDCGGVLSRFYTKGGAKKDPFQSSEGIIAMFDNGMLLSGFLNLYEKTLEERYLSAAKVIAAFITEKMAPAGDRIYALYCSKDGTYAEHSQRWSCFPGSFLSKVAISLLHMNSVSKDQAYSDCAQRLCDNALKYQEKETGRFMLLDGSTYTHPHCYTCEGLISSGKLLERQDLIDAGLAGVRWLLKKAGHEGFVRRNYNSNIGFPKAVSSDIQAQTVRLFYLAQNEDPGINDLSQAARKLLLFMLSFQNLRSDDNRTYGGFRYGTDTRDGSEINTYNSWASMFAMQAMVMASKGLAGYTPFLLV